MVCTAPPKSAMREPSGCCRTLASSTYTSNHHNCLDGRGCVWVGRLGLAHPRKARAQASIFYPCVHACIPHARTMSLMARRSLSGAMRVTWKVYL